MAGDITAHPSVTIYSRFVLSVYDLVVLKISNSYIWRCPSTRILAFYNQYVSANHLDVGVGTGYFLDKCTYPAATPRITLLDINSNSLASASTRIQRYQPATITANILEALPLGKEHFDSIGLSYLLHCLPGTMLDKAAVFANLKPFLSANGVFFGTTILSDGVRRNPAAKALMNFYNGKGIFNNQQDNLTDLEKILKQSFSTYSIDVVGCVALFTGRL